jgi:beta-glucosidase
MSMVPLDYSFPQELLNLVKYGYISEERINLSAERIIQLKLDVGLFDNPYPSLDDPNVGLVGSVGDRAFAVAAARESVTLLRNQTRSSLLTPPRSVKFW